MKQLLILAFSFLSIASFAQKQLPIIKANSKTAKILEEDGLTKGWTIDPKTNPDVFTTSKLVKAKSVKFKTDIDSIIFKIKPGEKKDFIVLLNGKDSCLTRITSPEIKNFSKIKPEIHDSIPLFINSESTIYVKSVLNKIDTLNLNFDSGTTELVITDEVLKNKVKSDPKLYNTYYNLSLGNSDYKTRVYPAQLTGVGTEGRFGWDLFDGKILELNYDKNVMVVHSVLPKYVSKDKSFTSLNIRYFAELFLIESTIEQSGIKNTDWFLFDTGYHRTAMLDNDLLKNGNFPTDKMEVIKKVIMRGATGNEIPVVTANLQTLKLGKYDLKDVPVQLITGNKPLRGANIHILGNEVLKRFNTFFDFQNNVVYLKPNHFYNDTYVEQKKSGA
ncbi:aspartyl protease family protein [Pedobacter sp. UBA5917]|jgi:hypothetical protein|uniref:aspartyl protease family protein n=1 Tax=Pedobacter sp. UBA5917 TaxID=1947061 RepID=UPI0025ED9327|nr:aspartyl protease family protein [Pedobacter sp. UBA5917]